MANFDIKSGTKMQVAFDVAPGEELQFNMVCTFYKKIDESAFLISVPMKDGKALPADETKKFIMKYTAGSESMILAGYVDDEVKEGIRRYWKIRRVTEQRQLFQRADERLKITLKVKYRNGTALPGEEHEMEFRDGMTLDISAGGMALFLNDSFDVGELCLITLPRIGTTEEGRAIEDVAAVVCWQREVPKGSLYRRLCGLQYRLGQGEEHQRMQQYVATVKKRYKI